MIVKPSTAAKRLQRSAWMLAVFLVVASAFQLSPFRFDTRDVGSSLEAFEQNRFILMNAALVRVLIVFPATILAVELFRRFAQPTVSAFFLVGGALSVVAGVANTVIGIPAEELRPADADAHAIEVIGDVLFWTQDNLATVANVAFASAAFSFAMWMWRQSFRQWWVLPGLAALPLLATSTLSWYFSAPEKANPVAAPWYAFFGIATLVAFVAWLVGMAHWATGSGSQDLTEAATDRP